MGWSQNVYRVINRNKYIGTRDKGFNPTMADPIYKSSWECRLMNMFDTNPNVLRWGYENVVIPYINFDGKPHRYFVDFYAEMRVRTGEIKKFLVEVKPQKDGREPQKPKNNNVKARNRYMYEMKTYITNKNKWNSAIQFCKSRGFEFKIVTEKELHLL